MTTLYHYDADTHVCEIYDRDAENAVGFSTRSLDMREAKLLSDFVGRVYQAGIRYGRQEIALRIRDELNRT